MGGIPWELVVTTAITTLTGLVVGSIYRKLGTYMQQSLTWRKEMDARIDEQAEKTNGQLATLMKAQQTTMRATLIHNAEKYFERGWLTPEERASWCDMHDQYSALGANGLIETYRHKLDELPDRRIA